MCFRPAGVEVDIHCPHCEKKLPMMGNTILKKCPFCKTAFDDADMENLKKQAGIDDSAAPAAGAPAGAPGAPGAPGRPAAPGAPGRPAAPGAPGRPGL